VSPECSSERGLSTPYITLTYTRELRAEDVELVPEVSLNLEDWNVGPLTMVLVSVEPISGTTSARFTWRASAPLAEQAQLYLRLSAQAR